MGEKEENGRSMEPVNFQAYIEGKGAIMKELKETKGVLLSIILPTFQPHKEKQLK